MILLIPSQKKYIKDNFKRLTIVQMSEVLNIPPKTIDKFLKNHLGRKQYEKLLRRNEKNHLIIRKNEQVNYSFNFKIFLADNINYFLLLFAIIFIVYFNSLGNGFVSDDIGGILKNPDLNNLKAVFSFGQGFVQKFIYYITFNLFGNNPTFFRIFNEIFHLGSTFLVFIILSTLTKKRLVALFAAVIFAVHPILIESVTWISGMPYTVYSFFLLLSFLFYILSKDNRKIYLASLAFFILAVNSSEKAIVFFFIMALYEISLGNIKNNWKRLIPYFLLNFVLIINYAGKVGQRLSSLEVSHYQDSGGMYNPFVQIPIAIGNYLKLIFWPDKLTLYQTEMSFNTAAYLFYLLIFLIFLAVFFWGWKKNKTVFFWTSFFFVSLLQTLTPFKISWIVAERYVYLGSIGIFVVVAMFFNWIFEKAREKNEKYKYAALALFAIIILSLSVRTIIRNMDWKNEDTLWISTAKTSPSGPNIHNNLGDVYGRQGNTEKSIEEFKKAIEINPQYADAYHNLASAYKETGKIDEAIENYKKAIEFNPNLWQSYQNLAAIYFDQEKYPEAYENMEKALKINPTDENIKKNLDLLGAKLK